MRLSRAVLAIAAAFILGGMAEPPQERYQRAAAAARAARESGDMAAYLRHVREVADFLSGHPGSRFGLARALSLAGDEAAAIEELKALADLGFGYDAGADPAFAALRADPRFAKVNRRLAANRRVAGRETAGSFRIGLQGRRPEGVAVLDSGQLAVGTWDGEIYRVSQSAPKLLARGSGMVAGIRADPATGTFLACFSDEAAGRALVQRHRTADGALVAMYPLPASGGFCNDIALLNDGGFVVTESNGGRVYRLAGNRLVPLPMDPLFYPNGIATDPSSGRVYVAHGGGITAFDPETGSSTALAAENTLLGAVDGMVWHQGALIAVQNVTVPSRVLRIVPDAQGRARVEPLLVGSPLLEGSTTVAARGAEAYVLSHTGIPSGDPPNDPILVRVPL